MGGGCKKAWWTNSGGEKTGDGSEKEKKWMQKMQVVMKKMLNSTPYLRQGRARPGRPRVGSGSGQVRHLGPRPHEGQARSQNSGPSLGPTRAGPALGQCISRWYKPKSGSIMYKNPWEIVGGYTLNPWPGVRVCQGLKKLTRTLTPAYPTQNPCDNH